MIKIQYYRNPRIWIANAPKRCIYNIDNSKFNGIHKRSTWREENKNITKCLRRGLSLGRPEAYISPFRSQWRLSRHGTFRKTQAQKHHGHVERLRLLATQTLHRRHFTSWALRNETKRHKHETQFGFQNRHKEIIGYLKKKRIKSHKITTQKVNVRERGGREMYLH